ncbi:sugar phosphate isomerase/epimerase family protein [Halalkalibacter akibai]|uniref:Sugar phosphate isomerases/epimerase n=1 Tax=Halalkalibacter akibai (strain ATCC 43226 / DSM 21942 / CIP 109018 / JCM 9157 / 1139) TaxID=1236973 RepID=W4QUD7_HALA3|nr:sugar phosphate isomerase/epimerase family protein [Halalkalibacter akibai]GAE35233.1 sugar phosphate isomerases/epimerase [Halalkalibacter akibai JCM 9157]
MNHFNSIDRLSLNQITTEKWSLKEAVDGCLRADVPWMALWRHKISEIGLRESKNIIKGSGIKISSVCRGGMFPATTAKLRQVAIDDNKRAVDEAAELGAEVLVLVCGPSAGKDISEGRKMVEEGIEELVPYAEERGIKLGIEPLHPMYAAERSVIVSLSEAVTLSEKFQAKQVGVVVDVFHVWWDHDLYNQINRAKGRILGFHISDWIVPTPDMLMGRGMMGDGVIELRRIRQAVEKAGYGGPIEVEIFNQKIWDTPGDEVLALMKERYLEHV